MTYKHSNGQPIDKATEKRCCRCGEVKPHSEFHKTKYRDYGIQDYCKPCRSIQQKVRIRTNSKAYTTKKRYYYEKSRYKELLRQYGITKEQYEEMERQQDFKCAICRREETFTVQGPIMTEPTVQRLSVDHCHKTGKVRRLLCTRCNHGLGYFGDDPELLRQAIAYLEFHNKES